MCYAIMYSTHFLWKTKSLGVLMSMSTCTVLCCMVYFSCVNVQTDVYCELDNGLLLVL